MTTWFDNLLAGANEALQKSYEKVVIDEVETSRILERERMAREEGEAERKVRAWDRYFNGPRGIVRERTK